MLYHYASQISEEHALWVMIAMKVAIVATVFLPLVSVIAMGSIWLERKLAGWIQSRPAIVHTGKFFGWAQPIADGVKLILKEDLVPKGADSFLFRFAPYIAFAPVLVAFLALPFGPQFVFEAGLSIGVLYLLAFLSIEVMGTILAGWGSNSKWAIYGAMREACQMVSYEVPLGLCIITGVLTAGTINLVELGYLQAGGLHDWFLYHNPFVFLAFFVYFVASMASSKRAPFDLPESESELVAGFHTEYSGIRWSFFFFAEYAGMFIIGVIQAMLFLGGWNSPFGQFDPVYTAVGYDAVAAGQAYFSGAIDQAITFADKADAINAANPALTYDATTGNYLNEAGQAAGLGAVGLIIVNLYSAAIVAFKAMLTIVIMIWVRWTLPRIRIDQVLHACVKVLLPLALIVLMGSALWIMLVPQPEPVTLTDVNGEQITNSYLGHLTGNGWAEAPIQTATQWLLTLVGVLLSLGVVGIIAKSWMDRDKMTKKTLFPDIMPVGDSVTYSPSYTPDAADGDAGGGPGDPVPA